MVLLWAGKGEATIYNHSAVSKRFFLAVSRLKLLNLTDYEEKKGTARSLYVTLLLLFIVFLY